jgi:hypothetical protein
MAAYGLNISEVLNWTPSQLKAMSEARNARDRSERMWQIALARIPGLADPNEYIEELMASLMPWEDWVAARAGGAPRIEEMTDEQLAQMGVHVVKKDDASGPVA